MIDPTTLDRLKAAALACTPLDIDTAQFTKGEDDVDCFYCGGEGFVHLEATHGNFDNCAIGVQFFGIGNEFGAADRYLREASPKTILGLIAHIEAMAGELEAAKAQQISKNHQTLIDIAAGECPCENNERWEDDCNPVCKVREARSALSSASDDFSECLRHMHKSPNSKSLPTTPNAKAEE